MATAKPSQYSSAVQLRSVPIGAVQGEAKDQAKPNYEGYANTQPSPFPPWLQLNVQVLGSTAYYQVPHVQVTHI